MSIYQKADKKGVTTLSGGTRVSKDDLRVEAYGTLDELNSFVGLLSCSVADEDLSSIQRMLFRIGGYLANENAVCSGVRQEDILFLEARIDELSSELTPLHQFILPKGSEPACICHVCRTVCRRAERCMVSLRNNIDKEMDNAAFLWMNRLSDFFFVLSRKLNKDLGIAEELL